LADGDVGLAGDQKLHAIEIWATGLNGDIQAFFFVEALIESGVVAGELGLCDPLKR
jgi:hypothetical protein